MTQIDVHYRAGFHIQSLGRIELYHDRNAQIREIQAGLGILTTLHGETDFRLNGHPTGFGAAAIVTRDKTDLKDSATGKTGFQAHGGVTGGYANQGGHVGSCGKTQAQTYFLLFYLVFYSKRTLGVYGQP